MKHFNLPTLPHLENPPAVDSAGLSVVSVTKKFGRTTVLHDVSFNVGRSEVVGLLGPDGAGKTVTFYSILGLLRINGGQIILDGEDISGLPLDQRARRGLGYLPQETSIFRGLTVALSGGERRRCEIARAMAANPTVMLFDEPFAGIDPMSVRDIKGMISKLERHDVGILITDQNVREMIDLLDRVYILHEGRIVFSGAPEAMLQDKTVRRLYLGEELFH